MIIDVLQFTKFTVEKASLLNKRFVLTSIPEYLDTSASLETGAKMRRRNDISYMAPMKNLVAYCPSVILHFILV